MTFLFLGIGRWCTVNYVTSVLVWTKVSVALIGEQLIQKHLYLKLFCISWNGFCAM